METTKLGISIHVRTIIGYCSTKQSHNSQSAFLIGPASKVPNDSTKTIWGTQLSLLFVFKPRSQDIPNQKEVSIILYVEVMCRSQIAQVICH